MRPYLLLLTLFSSLYSYPQELPKLYDDVSSAVVFIDVVSYDYSQVSTLQKVSTQSALGSGVLVSRTGAIWTAAHVVQAAEEIWVEFNDGDKYRAKVVTSNPNADVALLNIEDEFELKEKKVATIGDSNEVKVGEDVFVVGAPHGFKQSLSRGIISGRHVPENMSNGFERVEFFQTDAAINPGNSGGPMFNMKGEVIGIASSIYTTTGGFDGIGFAVAANVAKELLSEQANAWTGMESMVLSSKMARILNVPQESGILILKVSSKGSAAKIGLRGGFIPSTIAGREILLGGDIILEIAGVKVIDNTAAYQVRQKLKNLPKGKKFSMTILRQGAVHEAKVTKE